MERVNERVDIIKVLDLVIYNVMKLYKKEKVNNVKIVFKNDIIHIDMDDCIYTLSNVLMYRKFIDKISYKYKVLLKYFPTYNNEKIINDILMLYYKNNQVTVIINQKNINIK